MLCNKCTNLTPFSSTLRMLKSNILLIPFSRAVVLLECWNHCCNISYQCKNADLWSSCWMSTILLSFSMCSVWLLLNLNWFVKVQRIDLRYSVQFGLLIFPLILWRCPNLILPFWSLIQIKTIIGTNVGCRLAEERKERFSILCNNVGRSKGSKPNITVTFRLAPMEYVRTIGIWRQKPALGDAQSLIAFDNLKWRSIAFSFILAIGRCGKSRLFTVTLMKKTAVCTSHFTFDSIIPPN